jgi:membrane-bound lytic murein transglycosylase
MSLKAMIEYFKQHPEEVESYTKMNPRFVFFQIKKASSRQY